jgi:drug/metabolite transporter (DMT)-like permease
LQNDLSPRKRRTAWLLLAGMIVWMTGAQLLFKSAGLHAHRHPGLAQGFVLNVAMWWGLFSSGMSMLCWLGSLRTLPLSAAYPWTASIYVLTPVASAFLFNEVLSQRYFFGIALLVAGIFLSTGGAESNDPR